MIRILIWVWLALLSTTSLAQTELAGHMIMVRGDVTATNAAGEVRTLQRRSPIYSSDTVRTGSDAMAQLRFTDQALLALDANSELSIVEYQPPGEQGDGTVLLRLIEGGFRTLTGSIGRGNKEAYRVETPVASIGIRGTLYSVNMQALRLSAGVWQGGIRISSEQGVFDLGMDARYDFATLDQDGFRGLLAAPRELQPIAPTRAPLTIDNNSTDEQAPIAPTPNQLNNDTNPRDGRTPIHEDLNTINPFDQRSGSTNEEAFRQNNQLKQNSDLDLIPTPEPEPTPEPPAQAPEPTPEPPAPTPEPTLDSLLSADERDSLDNNQQSAFLLENGNRIEVRAFTPDGEANSDSPYAFVAENPIRVYRSDTMRANNIEASGFSHLIEWGWWSYDNELGGINGDDELPQERPDQLWMVVTPAELNSIPTEGTITFNTVYGIGIDDQGGRLESAEGGFTLQFDTGDISDGYLELGYGSRAWSVSSFDGKLTHDNDVASLNMNIIKGNYTPESGVTIEIDTPNSHFSGVLTKDIEGDEQLLFASGLTLRANDGDQEHWAQAFIIWQEQ